MLTAATERVLYVDSDAQLHEWFSCVHADAPLGFDLETTGLDPTRGSILLAQFSDGDTTVVASWRDCRKALVDQLQKMVRYERLLIIQNAKFEYGWILVRTGLRLSNMWDTRVADLVLRCGKPKFDVESSLKHLAHRYLGLTLDKELQKSFIDADPDTFVPTDEQVEYAAIDAAVVVPLRRTMLRRIETAGLGEIVRLENALVPVLAEMEIRGMGVDPITWREVLGDLGKEVSEQEVGLVDQLTAPLIRVRARMYQAAHAARQAWEQDRAEMKAVLEASAVAASFETKRERRAWINAQLKSGLPAEKGPSIPHLAEGPINLRSQPQLLGALNEIEVQVGDTSQKTLVEYSRHEGTHPVLEALLEWRALAKLQSAFGENILAKVSEGRIHPDFNQLVRTGRMSCRNPNLQQIPGGERGGPAAEYGRRIRQCFVAPPRRKLVCADYSSIEWRLAAELYAEEGAITELLKGRDADPHRDTAAKMFNVSPDDVLHKQRQAAKTINYGILYRISQYGLAPRLNCTVEQAKGLLDRWEATYPAMTKGMKLASVEAVRTGESRTKLGRRRCYEVPPKPRLAKGEAPELWKKYRATMNGIMRQAANQPIQGTSADITKIALRAIHERLAPYGDDAFLVNAVHDEIIVEADVKVANQVQEIVVEEMETAGRYFLRRVPVLIDCKVGDVWGH